MTSPQADILIVDDTPANLRLLETMLTDHGYRVRPAPSGKLALRTARSSLPDVILLDINMPEMNGYEVCEALKADDELKDIPVIFLSALDDTADKVKAFRVGGVDYISKPFQLEEVLVRVETQLALHRRQVEIERLYAESQKHFIQLSSMKDEFLSMASHDIKNPLGIMKNAVDVIRLNGYMQDEKGQELLEMIERNADRAISLVSDLLDLARLDTGQALSREPVEIDGFLRTAAEDFRFFAEERRVNFAYKPFEKKITISIDRNRFGQVIHNLLSNAIKYTPEQGGVELAASANGGDVAISVRDTGLGIPPDDLPYLFDRFHRVDTKEHLAVEGTGLGLAIVKTIVNQHGGTIEVESTLGQGSVFQVVLPLAS